MLASLQNPYVAEIFTNNRFYKPGSIVTGHIIFTLRRKLLLDRLVANLRGNVKVSFELKPTAKKGSECYSSKPIKYSNGRQLINQSVVLWSQTEAVCFIF